MKRRSILPNSVRLPATRDELIVEGYDGRLSRLIEIATETGNRGLSNVAREAIVEA